MPLKKARKGASKKAIQNAVSYNISELTKTNRSKSPSEKRSKAQIVAIAFSAAGKSKKRK